MMMMIMKALAVSKSCSERGGGGIYLKGCDADMYLHYPGGWSIHIQFPPVFSPTPTESQRSCKNEVRSHEV